MNCHQILSGACNAGDRCFAVGSVEGIPFTVSSAIVIGGVVVAPPCVLEIGAPANQSADSIWVRMYWCASIQIKRNIGGGSGSLEYP